MNIPIHITRPAVANFDAEPAACKARIWLPMWGVTLAVSAARASAVVITLTDWFIPADVRLSRTDWELARTFVFTHLFGPLIAQPLWIYLWLVTPDPGPELGVLASAICGFWLLPFALRAIGSMKVVPLVSFQGLAAASLYGAYYYGGFASPFLPWLVVSLLLGMCYLSKNILMVVSIFVFDVIIFLGIAWRWPFPPTIPIGDLSVLGWLSISSATVYMTWMALYYSRIVSLRSEMEAEAARSRATSIQLEHARVAAEANGQARSRFFTKMSHELRTPLNAIIGYSELLLEEIEAVSIELESNAEHIQDVRRINAAGKHLLSLVARVLDPNMIEQDALRIEVRRFRLGELCDEVADNASPAIERNDNYFAISCPQRNFELRTDPTKLRQILINLLSNAGKFTSDGIVRLDLDVVRGAYDESLRAVVSDTGIGISEEALPRLFTEYEQGDAAVMANFGGTGIGLALSRRFANLLGGDIAVTSTLGRGSRFTLTIPASASPGAGPETSATGDDLPIRVDPAIRA